MLAHHASVGQVIHAQLLQLKAWAAGTTPQPLNLTVPFVHHDSALFVYTGAASKVEWMGDFNGWGYDKSFANKGTPLGDRGIWYLKASFPPDARLDYKILLNGSQWILDPRNPHQQWSGVGGGSPNSELRMPQWKEEIAQQETTAAPKGTVKSDLLFNSQRLGYQVMYSLYLPHGYRATSPLPTVYVTDGYEYMHPRMGNMVTVLDNLIAQGKIKPVMAVFIDHREPINRSNNKRMTELAMNAGYYDFLANELVPYIEAHYAAEPVPASRAILGTSMGGLAATYFAFSPQSVFGLAGIQSPAFWTQPRIYELCQNPDNPMLKVSMTTGTINDSFKETRKMQEILRGTACQFTYREVNEGHSWGNWRGLIDDILLDFFHP
jgi:enterochelin esterase family protein